jgi:dethiobiotin synthase
MHSPIFHIISDTMPRGYFVTATGTGVGKTHVARALARALDRMGRPVAAIKPVETGVVRDPLDATSLARACGRPELARAPGLYRARLPLAPLAATLAGEPPPPPPHTLADRVRDLAPPDATLLVEGAGGLLVPLDERHSLADLATALRLPLLLVASDRLGVLSHALTCADSAAARALPVAAVILSTHERDAADPSTNHNRHILAQRLGVPVVLFPPCEDDDDALADAAEEAGLIRLLFETSSPPDAEGVCVRPYRSDDEDEVAELWTRVFGYTEARNEPRYALALKHSHGDELLLVARDGDDLAGTAMGGYDGHRGWLYSVAVDPARRRAGIGRMLVRDLEARLTALGAPKINLQIRGGNEAVIPFYEALGYRVEGHTSMGRLLKR